MKRLAAASLLIALVPSAFAPVLAEETSTGQIDRDVWSVVSRTVVDYDIEGMAAVYHPDAVLVSPRRTVPIADALAGWSRGMEEQLASGASATVSFRFTTRQDGETTAFEVGMFNYIQVDGNGGASPVYVPFEALLVKKDGRWLILMERQLEAADEADWNALVQD